MSETIRGTYRKELRVKEEWRLFLIDTDKGIVKCAGIFNPIMYEGQPFLLTGCYETYKDEREATFKVSTYLPDMPMGDDETIAFIRSVRGIGKKRGQVISEYCEGDLSRLKKEDSAELSQRCSGLTPDHVCKLVRRYAELRDTAMILKKYGSILRVEQCSKLLAKYEGRTEKILSEHPYWADGIIGFKACDAIGTINGVAPDCGERLESAAKSALSALCRKTGAAMVGVDELLSATEKMLRETKLGGAPSEKIREALNVLREHNLVIHALQKSKHYVYPKKNYDNEVAIAKWVANHSKVVEPERKSTFQSAFSDWCCSHLDIQLSSKQAAAIWMAGTNRLSVITGGPGTGKTTCLRTLIECYKGAYPDAPVTLMAPTGLAAKRMAEKTGLEAKTIHSTFRLIPLDESERDEFGPDYNDMLIESLRSGLVVIDEFSMVGLDIASFVVNHLDFSSDTQVVFVGDVDQLPPVSSGSVLQALISSKAIPVTVLDRNFRQSDASHIPELATALNSGKPELIQFQGGCRFVEATDQKAVTAQLIEAYLAAIKKYGIKNVLVLTPLRKKSEKCGDVCASELNRLIREQVNPASCRKRELKLRDRVFRVGDRVINQKNDETVVNGDIGTVSAVSADGKSLTVEMDCGTVVEYTTTKASDALDFAYAVTVHKAQGGEYDCVLMPFLPGQEFFLTRKLCYTAVTRAKKEFVGVGSARLLSAAATNVRSSDKPRDLLCGRILYYQQINNSGTPNAAA